MVALPNAVTAAVYVSVEGATILAHVTRDALHQLSLAVGSSVIVLIKSIAIYTIEHALPIRPLRHQSRLSRSSTRAFRSSLRLTVPLCAISSLASS